MLPPTYTQVNCTHKLEGARQFIRNSKASNNKWRLQIPSTANNFINRQNPIINWIFKRILVASCRQPPTTQFKRHSIKLVKILSTSVDVNQWVENESIFESNEVLKAFLTYHDTTLSISQGWITEQSRRGNFVYKKNYANFDCHGALIFRLYTVVYCWSSWLWCTVCCFPLHVAWRQNVSFKVSQWNI